MKTREAIRDKAMGFPAETVLFQAVGAEASRVPTTHEQGWEGS